MANLPLIINATFSSQNYLPLIFLCVWSFIRLVDDIIYKKLMKTFFKKVLFRAFFPLFVCFVNTGRYHLAGSNGCLN